MTMRLPFAAAILSLSIVACDKPADPQQQSDIAQAEAQQKIAAAKKEADQKITAAQTEADRRTADLQASFARTVEDYRHKTQTDLGDLDRKIDSLDAEEKTATGKAKNDLDAKLPPIKTKRAAFAADFKSIDNAAAVTWDATKARLDSEWNDLKTLVDGVS